MSAPALRVSDAFHVRQFTTEAGQHSPEFPELMTVEEVNFIGKMILDETMELFATVHEPAQAKTLLKNFIDESKDIQQIVPAEGDSVTLIAEQADALVDVYYYSLNAAAKKGMNLSAIFNIVHAANMAKRDPTTGKFIKRDDGKIIKPTGWKAPDVEAEISRQVEEGSWIEDEATDAAQVREFTSGAGSPCPDRPEVAMSEGEVDFLGKMILDEVMELFATVHPPASAKSTLKGFIDASKDIPRISPKDPSSAVPVVAEQADALVDIYYYSLNCAAKKGVNLSSIFGIVHAANMAKRDPATGQFLRRADGKIIKPEGWQAPDVSAEIRRQMKGGAWTREVEGAKSAAGTPVKQ